MYVYITDKKKRCCWVPVPLLSLRCCVGTGQPWESPLHPYSIQPHRLFRYSSVSCWHAKNNSILWAQRAVGWHRVFAESIGLRFLGVRCRLGQQNWELLSLSPWCGCKRVRQRAFPTQQRGQKQASVNRHQIYSHPHVATASKLRPAEEKLGLSMTLHTGITSCMDYRGQLFPRPSQGRVWAMSGGLGAGSCFSLWKQPRTGPSNNVVMKLHLSKSLSALPQPLVNAVRQWLNNPETNK